MKTLFILLAAAISWLGACNKPVDPERSLNIVLHGCAENIFDGVRLCFEEVVEDSRCPANAMCVWQGAAVAKFSFTKQEEIHLLNLATISMGPAYHKDTIISGYKIEFLDLSPYPGLPPTTPPSNEIKAKVRITKI